MLFLAGDPDITPITNLINTWIYIGQALVESIGALAYRRLGVYAVKNAVGTRA